MRATKQTHTSALKFYARTVRLEPALQLLQAMQAKGVVADAITYNTLLNTCCKAGMMSRAEELLQVAEALAKVSSG